MPETAQLLLDAKWCEQEDLDRASGVLTAAGFPCVVIFLQLPYYLRLPEAWLRIPYDSTPAYAFARVASTSANHIERPLGPLDIRFESSFSDTCRIRNGMLENDPYGFVSRTQVLLSVHLWRRWADLYPRYLDLIEREPNANLYDYKVLDSADNLPWTAANYQYKLVQRLRTEAVRILNFFLPSYRVSCLDPRAQDVEVVEKYFIMDQHLRLIPMGRGKTLLERDVRPFDPRRCSEKKFLARLSTRPTNTVYEEYLLNALRHVDLGLPELAVVQTVMTLEWFFTEIISDRVRRRLSRSAETLGARFRRFLQSRVSFGDERSRLTDRIRDYLDALGLPVFSSEPQLWSDLHQLVALRNRTVHRLRGFPVSSEDGRWSVTVGMRIIDVTMAFLLGPSDLCDPGEKDETRTANPSGPKPTKN
jgi:hypothetical protein